MTGDNMKKSLSNQILQYLKQNPDAGDTLEGIATWWLEQQRIERVVKEVAEVLDSLIKEGKINPQQRNSGPTIYKIKK